MQLSLNSLPLFLRESSTTSSLSDTESHEPNSHLLSTPLPEKPLSDLYQKITKVVKIVFQTALSVFLYWVNPSLFALGFIAGVVADEYAALSVKKIKDIWITQPWSTCVLGSIAAVFSLPVTLATGSFFLGAHLGSMMTDKTKKILSPNPKDLSEPMTKCDLISDEKLEKPVVAESG